MLSISDIETDESKYREVLLMISQVMHNKKSYGAGGMLSIYKPHIEELKHELAIHEFCALLGILEYCDPSFSYEDTVRVPKIIPSYNVWLQVCYFKELSKNRLNSLLNKCYEVSIPQFRKRGILLEDIDEVI